MDLPLESIVILFRDSDTLNLWGIPYEMREGQEPRDLLQADSDYLAHLTYPRLSYVLGPYVKDYKTNKSGWIWLGSPGWFGDMSRERQEEVKAFLARYKEAIPDHPNEWSRLADFGGA